MPLRLILWSDRANRFERSASASNDLTFVDLENSLHDATLGLVGHRDEIAL
jgi:hypothetical protein